MAPSSSGVAAFSRLVDRTRVPGPHPAAPHRRGLLPQPPLAARSPPRRRPRRHLLPPRLPRPHRGIPRPPRCLPRRPPPSRPRPPAPHCAPLLPPPPRLASCLIKAAAALASCVLRVGPAGSRFPPRDHPFVQALASGADGARAELTRQAARMVAEGVDGVVGFLWPFVTFAVVRKREAAFARDLIGALAAAAAAAAKPDSAVPLLKLPGESLLHFGRGDGEELRLWLSSVRCLVDAYAVLLRKLAHAEMLMHSVEMGSIGR